MTIPIQKHSYLAIFFESDMLFNHSLNYLSKVQRGYRSGTLIAVKTDEHKPPRSTGSQDLRFSIETEQETDGRWIAEIPEVPGALAYGKTKEEAISKAYAIALRAVADDVEESQQDPPNSISLERSIA